MSRQSILDEPFELILRCVKVRQPIGDFFIAAIPSESLIEITFSDVRQISDRDMDTYLGIQREVDPKRVREIATYVDTIDACFPTAVILAVEGRCAEFDEATGILTLRSDLTPDGDRKRLSRIEIAKVLDGQHRIEGLRTLSKENRPFDVNVSIFVDMDIESQAYLFSKVNLAQTKVKKSLVYDLFDYAKSRSPQKTCHNAAVALDKTESSPFRRKIKRLGVATKGRYGELLTQSTFVEALLPYLSANAVEDRDLYLRGRTPPRATRHEEDILIFRNMFLDERDLDITRVIFNYFSAVRDLWPRAWASDTRGQMLSKTNGFRALMRLLRPLYLHIAAPGDIPEIKDFAQILGRSNLRDEDFNTEEFKPGTSGETSMFYRLGTEIGVLEDR
jgi:DGQHR domain-containing protein